MQYPESIKNIYTTARSDVFGSEENPDTLYHYTSMDIAQLILENNSFRFSHSYFMNDTQEIRKGLDIIWHILHEASEEYREIYPDIGVLLRYMAITIVLKLEDQKTRLEILATIEKEGLKESNPKQFALFQQFIPSDVFVSCFSAEQDSLPMWYMYANHAKGAALGFSFEKLISEHNDIVKDVGAPVLTAKVIYEEDKFRSLVSGFVKGLMKIITESREKNGNLKALQNGALGNDFFSSATYYLSILAVSLKHKAFAHEKEWRLFALLSRQGSPVQKTFAVSSGTLKPHHFIHYPTHNTAKITEFITASGNPNSSEWLEIYLNSIGAIQCKIIPSTIPFRDI